MRTPGFDWLAAAGGYSAREVHGSSRREQRAAPYIAMSDFTRTKMIFVVALLAVAFMLRPMLEEIEGPRAGFNVLGWTVLIHYPYYLFVGSLALAAYFYALELVSGRSFGIGQRAGNVMYALSVVIPPAFLVLFLTGQLGRLIHGATGSNAAALAGQYIVTGLLAVAAAGAFVYIRRALRAKDKSSSVERLGREETDQMNKATGLYEAGLYDLVLVESFRAIETALKKTLMARDIRVRGAKMGDLVEAAAGAGIVSARDESAIKDLRAIRNRVVHEAETVTRNQAEDAMDAARRVVISINRALMDADEADAGD
jgi:HEPN domain-containing protein